LGDGTGTAAVVGIALPLHAENLPAFNLTIKDGRYLPEQVEIPAGQKIKLVIKNDGPGPEEFESSDLNRRKSLRPEKPRKSSSARSNPAHTSSSASFIPKPPRPDRSQVSQISSGVQRHVGNCHNRIP